jgi:hypothetical protein
MQMATVVQELRRIAKSHGGVLNPHDVVEFARNEKTALHSKFTWDDAKAGHEYRLWQARQVIRVNVEVLEGSKEPVKVFVSLRSDRGVNGYRPLVSVMSNDEQRAELLQQAKDEADAWRVKYRRLIELVPVFEAMDRVFVRKQSSAKPKGRRKLQPA